MKIYRKDLSTCAKECVYLFAYRNKYDVLSNEAVSWIFDLLKNGKFGSHTRNMFLVEIKKANIKEFPSTFDNFKLDAKSANGIVYISILISEEFAKSDYQSFNYAIYETVRHELEHVDKFVHDKKPDGNYVDIYRKLLLGVDLEEHVDLVSQYILSDVELDSYLKSIMYVAKKEKISAIDVIERVLNRAFFNNDPKLLIKGNEDSNIKSIVEKTRQCLRGGLAKFYPKFKEVWL